MDITCLKGIGEKTARLFEKLGITTVEELLHYYPRDYERMDAPVPIAQLRAGGRMAVCGVVGGDMTLKHVRGLSILNFTISDASGALRMTYFNMPYLKNTLKSGSRYIFRGLVKQKGAELVMEQAAMYKSAEYEKLSNSLMPEYSLTKGLRNKTLTKAVKQAFEICGPREEYLPERIVEKYGFMPRMDAMHELHFPSDPERLTQARRRLVFDEFFLFILSLRRFKEKNGALPNSCKMIETAQTARLIEALPYRLTAAQARVWEEIRADLCGDFVMNRLIQGDVGSGKTILAFLALIMCVANGYQGAMMVPTEVLARQHFEELIRLKKTYGLNISPVLLTGSVPAKERREIYEKIADGEADIIVGTHALIQEKVSYKKLALVVTDEQHRFGVRQRESLAKKGEETVHVLVMSATPIPRTLAIILYGDLDISALDELPADRLPVKTCVIKEQSRPAAYRFIEKEVSAGRQAYVICPMAEEGEVDGLENVISYSSKLKAVLPPSMRIAYLHGRMKPAEKNDIMEQFETRRIDVLVSTTVIEVGVNVPNATVMLVENAERFGLSQLHQLRGRVGRGKRQSYCVFVCTSESGKAMERLKVLNSSNDGFYIASCDLKLRGPGDLFGVRQSGALSFELGDVFTDADVLAQASKEADYTLGNSPSLSGEENAALKNILDKFDENMVDFRTI